MHRRNYIAINKDIGKDFSLLESEQDLSFSQTVYKSVSSAS